MSWYCPAENQLILFCGTVAYAKIEFSLAAESEYFSPKMQIWGPVGNEVIFRGILEVINKRVV
jgi:hypothetical protein